MGGNRVECKGRDTDWGNGGGVVLRFGVPSSSLALLLHPGGRDFLATLRRRFTFPFAAAAADLTGEGLTNGGGDTASVLIKRF